MFKFLVVLFSLLAVSHAQLWGLGPCPNIPAVSNFSIANMQARWFEQLRYPNDQEGIRKCITSEFKVTNGTIRVTNIALDPQTNAPTNANGTLTMTANNTADFVLNRTSTAALTSDRYRIIGTDYTSYYVVYSCQNYWFFHFKYVGIFTRDRFISPFNTQTIPAAKAVLTKYNLDVSNTTLLPVDMITCPLFW